MFEKKMMSVPKLEGTIVNRGKRIFIEVTFTK